MKKIFMTAFLTIISWPVFALPISCVITDSAGLDIEVTHDLNLTAHGPLDHIDFSEVATGFISSSNGHIVISVTEKSSGVTLSTSGTPTSGKMVLSQALFSPDSWINIQCQE